MVYNKIMILLVLGSPALILNKPVIKIGCGVFDRCGWHSVDKVTHPIGNGVTHVVKEGTKLVDKSDKDINDWWEHVKNDTGPAINKGAIHLLTTIIDSSNNALTHPCPSGHDSTFQDRNGNTIHKCTDANVSSSLPGQPASNQGVAGEQDGSPVSLVNTADGPKIFPRYCSRVPFDQTIEIYDSNTKMWVQRIFLPPSGCVVFAVTPDINSHGTIVMRFDYRNSLEVTVDFLQDGEEFTV